MKRSALYTALLALLALLSVASTAAGNQKHHLERRHGAPSSPSTPSRTGMLQDFMLAHFLVDMIGHAAIFIGYELVRNMVPNEEGPYDALAAKGGQPDEPQPLSSSLSVLYEKLSEQLSETRALSGAAMDAARYDADCSVLCPAEAHLAALAEEHSRLEKIGLNETAAFATFMAKRVAREAPRALATIDRVMSGSLATGKAPSSAFANAFRLLQRRAGREATALGLVAEYRKHVRSVLALQVCGTLLYARSLDYVYNGTAPAASVEALKQAVLDTLTRQLGIQVSQSVNALPDAVLRSLYVAQVSGEPANQTLENAAEARTFALLTSDERFAFGVAGAQRYVAANPVKSSHPGYRKAFSWSLVPRGNSLHLDNGYVSAPVTLYPAAQLLGNAALPSDAYCVQTDAGFLGIDLPRASSHFSFLGYYVNGNGTILKYQRLRNRYLNLVDRKVRVLRPKRVGQLQFFGMENAVPEREMFHQPLLMVDARDETCRTVWRLREQPAAMTTAAPVTSVAAPAVVHPGTQLVSPSGKFAATFDATCVLTVAPTQRVVANSSEDVYVRNYHTLPSSQKLWTSTSRAYIDRDCNHNSCLARFSADGRLEIVAFQEASLKSQPKVLFSTAESRLPHNRAGPFSLQVDDKGFLVIRDGAGSALWASSTASGDSAGKPVDSRPSFLPIH